MSSKVGTESCFSIHPPAVSEEQPVSEVASVNVELEGHGTILIMDDEEIIREIVRNILEFSGYTVESCANGREAVDKYRKAFEEDIRFDAVIMDLTIPGGMGGKEAAGLILEIDPEALLIASSGYSNDPVIAAFKEYGFSGAVAKPFSAASLAGEVKRLVVRKQKRN